MTGSRIFDHIRFTLSFRKCNQRIGTTSVRHRGNRRSVKSDPIVPIDFVEFLQKVESDSWQENKRKSRIVRDGQPESTESLRS